MMFSRPCSRRPRSLFLTAALLLPISMLGVSGCDKPKASANPEEVAAEGGVATPSEGKDSAKAGGLIQVANDDLSNGRYNAARKRAEEALAADDSNVDAYAVLGAANWRAGDFKDSYEAYKKGVELNPGHFGATLGFATALQANGEHEKALEVLDGLIAKESEGFAEAKCVENSCDVGSCDQATQQCRPSMQVAPRFRKLSSQYLLLDVDNALKTADELFVGVGGADHEVAIARAYSSFLRPLSGKGKLVELEGSEGRSSLGLNYAFGAKYTQVKAGGKSQLAVLSEIANESMVNAADAQKLGLEELGKAKLPGQEQELSVVIIPEIAIGDLKIKNVPAVVQDLSAYGSELGSVPSFVLGQQVLSRFGSMLWDFPKSEMVVRAEPLSSPPEGSVEVPMIMLDTLSNRVPAVQITVDGGKHPFWTWLGGFQASGIAVSKREYLRAGHRPEDLENPEDADQGLKIVYINKFSLGDLQEKGVGGLVMLNTPPDAVLGGVLNASTFQLDGYINYAMFARWAMTYDFRHGKLYIQSPATANATAMADSAK